MPKLDDYGGNRYGTRYRVKRTKENMRSFTCNDCGKLFYLSHREALRNVPRCPNCGASGEETEPSVKRRLIVTKKQLSKVANSVLDFKPLQCRVCHERFRSAGGLKIHYEKSHGIVDDF